MSRQNKIASGSIALIFAALILFPLYIMVKISFGVPSDIFSENPSYLMRHVTARHFKDVFASGGYFLVPFTKSALTAFFASIAALIISIPSAYAISRFDYRLRYPFVLLIFMTRMMPEVSIALPVSIKFISLGLFDTISGLILAHLIRILPVTCFILVGVFSAFPPELEKQALIDGCSRGRALCRIVVPLSLGGISVAGIFAFLLSWDEFIYASYLTLTQPTLPLKMYYYIARGDIFYSATYAVIITVPVILLTLGLQKYIRPGYLSGAIKG